VTVFHQCAEVFYKQSAEPNTRRLVQLTIDDEDDQRTDAMMDMLLAKKRSEDRRNWLQEKGDMAEIEV